MGALKTELMAFEEEDMGDPQHPELASYFLGHGGPEALEQPLRECPVCGDTIERQHSCCDEFDLISDR